MSLLSPHDRQTAAPAIDRAGNKLRRLRPYELICSSRGLHRLASSVVLTTWSTMSKQISESGLSIVARAAYL